MKTIDEASLENSKNHYIMAFSDQLHLDADMDFKAGAEWMNQQWKEKLRWIPVKKILPDEGELVLVSPCENPKDSDIDLCWYKNGKFKLYVAMKDDDVNGSGVKRPDMTSSTRFWKGVNKI